MAMDNEGGTGPLYDSDGSEDEAWPVRKQRSLAQDDSSPAWRRHRKQFFVLSSAGKPVYSRFGDESRLSAFFGVLQALVSFVEDAHDTVRHMVAGKHKVVFLLEGPLYFVAVSRGSEPVPQLRRELKQMHAQILSLLTGTINRKFASRSTYDMRALLGGAEKFLDSLVLQIDSDMSFLADGIKCLRMPGETRQALHAAIDAHKRPEMLFAVLLCDNELVAMLRRKKRPLQASDLLLIFNFVNGNPSFSSGSSWTPICLPNFNDSGFLHAHISYITEHCCLMLMGLQPDNFYLLQDTNNAIVASLQEQKLLHQLEYAYTHREYNVADLRIDGLMHFLYKSTYHNQCTWPAVPSPFSISTSTRRRLFALYQHARLRLSGSDRPRSFVYLSTEYEVLVGWASPAFHLYAVFEPFSTKQAVVAGSTRITQFVKSHEASLFITSAPLW